jgi:hypothetical protein
MNTFALCIESISMELSPLPRNTTSSSEESGEFSVLEISLLKTLASSSLGYLGLKKRIATEKDLVV